MSTSQCATELGSDERDAESLETGPQVAVPGGTSRLLKGLLIGFAATMTIAPGLAGWYLGERIVAAGSPAPPAAVLENRR
ncbi:MAG TPA: hypothetical protein VME17_16360 [Bryobacteraceae bacterium]|nr:hypothetical protein [Bryobacteraceae bacterium]